MIYKKGEILLASSGEDAKIYQSSFEKAYLEIARNTQEALEMLDKKRYDVVLVDESLDNEPYQALKKLVPATRGAMTLFMEENKPLSIPQMKMLAQLESSGIGTIFKNNLKPENLEILILRNFDAHSLIILHKAGFNEDEMRAMGIPILKPDSY